MDNGKQFRAVTITTKSALGHGGLAEAFNDWVEVEQPHAIVHIHYFHDADSHQSGYQIVYEGSGPNGDE